MRKNLTKLAMLLSRMFGWIFGFLYNLYILSIMRTEINNGTLEIGQFTYGVPYIRRCKGDTAKITIGKFCSLSPGIKIFSGCNHNSTWISTYPFRIRFDLPGAYRDGQPSSKGDVVIGNDVWIGEDTKILSGVTIGDGVVIAAGSVVTMALPDYSVCGGIPAKVLKFRFPPEIIEKMEAIKWWDWDLKKIIETVDLLSSANISEFVSRFGNTINGRSG